MSLSRQVPENLSQVANRTYYPDVTGELLAAMLPVATYMYVWLTIDYLYVTQVYAANTRWYGYVGCYSLSTGTCTLSPLPTAHA